MKVLRNALLAAAIASPSLSAVAQTNTLSTPTTPQHVQQILTRSTIAEKGVPSPYAEINNPSVTLTTKHILDGNGGVLIDTRLPQDEWGKSVIVVYANDRIGAVPVKEKTAAALQATIAGYPGFQSLYPNASEATRAAEDLAKIAEYSMNRDGDMFAVSVRHADKAYINGLTEGKLAASVAYMRIQESASGDGHTVDINGQRQDSLKEMYRYLSPDYYQDVAPYWDGAWIIHEMGHTHNEQDRMHNAVLARARYSNVELDEVIDAKWQSEIHSDLQMMFTALPFMQREGEPRDVAQAFTDGVVRMRERGAFFGNLRHYIDVAGAMKINVDPVTNSVTLDNPHATGATGARMGRLEHASTVPVQAAAALMMANYDTLGAWGPAKQAEVHAALFNAFFSHPEVTRTLADRTGLTYLETLPAQQQKTIALDVAKDVARRHKLIAPSAIVSTEPLAPKQVEFMKQGFIPVDARAPYSPQTPVPDLLVLSSPTSNVHTAVIRQQGNLEDVSRLMVPLINDPRVDPQAKKWEGNRLIRFADSLAVDMKWMDTPGEGGGPLAPSVLIFQVDNQADVAMAMGVTEHWLSTQTSPVFTSGRFAKNDDVARLFMNTYGASPLSEHGPEGYVARVLENAFDNSRALFSEHGELPTQTNMNTPAGHDTLPVKTNTAPLEPSHKAPGR